MKKTVYETPLTELYQIKLEEGLLTGSVEAMRTVAGSWDDEEA